MAEENISMRVLVVDDEKGLRDMLAYTLRRMKFTVAVAEDGQTGVAAAMAGDFDAILCDVMMPGMDGLTLLATLKRERPELEIIMATGFPSDESSARAKTLGAFEYIGKPCELKALGALLQSAGARKREHAQANRANNALLGAIIDCAAAPGQSSPAAE